MRIFQKVSRSLTSLSILFFVGCSDSSNTSPAPDPIIEFTSNAIAMNEGDKQIKVSLSLSKALPAGITAKVSLVPGSGLVLGQSEDVYTTPAATSGEITFQGPLSTLEFYINSNFDTKDEADEQLLVTLVQTDGIKLGTKTNLTITIADGSLSSGLVAEYTFTGNLDDTSSKGHHGTNHGATLTTGKSGSPNSGYAFSGSSYITIANNNDVNFDTNQNFTVSVWVEPAAVQNDMAGIINDIIRQWAGDAQGYPYGISYYNSSNISAPLTFAGARYDGSACGHIPQAFSGSVTNQYHNVVLKKEVSSLTLYVDNVLAQSVTDITTCSTSNISDVFIGCRGNLLRCFTGKVDDIRIYNRALTTAEIFGLYYIP